ncbi:MAG: excinuclease ABC subunit C, partial [Clostridia bacterium]|nr:excinuclease ABC subunit C [Clostridia bacterium]
SNISGVDKVGPMVVFTDGVKDSNEYRRFKIKTVEGADDFASLKEVLTRRIARMREDYERFPTPDLVIIDGGKGQLSAVKEVFDRESFEVELISLAKKEEEIFTVHSSEGIILQKNDYCLRLLQRIRDEAHRFAITYHRSLRNKRTFFSQLNEIPGLGKKKINALLEKFGSVAEIAKADIEELKEIDGIGEKHANAVYSHFHTKGDKYED